MALSVTTALKNEIANLCYSAATYAALGAGFQQTLIDNAAAAALTHLEMMAQWYTFTSGTGAGPDEWYPWFVYEVAWRLAPNACPDREEIYNKRRKQLQREAMLSYSPAALNVSPSSSEAFVYNTLNNRKFVLNHTARLNPPLYPNPHSVDAALDESLTFVWNKSQWAFARRPVRMKITRSTFTGGTYTHATKTISGLTSVSTSLPAGTRFYPTDGTGASLRDFVIASTTSTTIVLDTSLGSAADGQTDIAGFYYLVTFEGMQASESFDSVASGWWFFTGETGERLCWADSTEFAALQSTTEDNSPDKPQYFRTHQPSAGVTTWLFFPPPDADYELRGEVLVQQASDPSSTTDTGPFSKFASEFMPTIRKLQLSRVLTNHGRHDANLHREVADEIDSLFPTYQSPGDGENHSAVRDVYNDTGMLSNNRGWGYRQIGGGI